MIGLGDRVRYFDTTGEEHAAIVARVLEGGTRVNLMVLSAGGMTRGETRVPVRDIGARDSEFCTAREGV